jgi:hypothetical protein
MTRPHVSCARCGAHRDEHDADYGPCSRTQCEAFSDPYYTFYEGCDWAPSGKVPAGTELYHVPKPRPRRIPEWAYIVIAFLLVGFLFWMLHRS